MTSTQFPQNEAGEILNKLIPVIKRRKIKFAILYLFVIIYFSIPGLQVPFLTYDHFRVTSLMEQRALEHKLIFSPEQSWINISDVNPNLLKAIVSMEDDDFFNHKGIDWKQLNKSIRKNERRGKIVRGASTITMQTAKNLFLTTSRNFLRKGKEVLIALRMEKELSKKTILQAYINAVEWGDGIFGIKKAAEVYFGKEPSGLNVNQCARLAAVIPSPLEHKPNTNSPYVIRRSSIILGRLNDVILFPGS